nr:GDSL esterase/lipase At1g71250-like [Physcomitrium patens]|eukprot:XP_024395505.1 GDSL esterase/lipase At1g71250-like [Physcomitrella patens]
MTEVMNQLPRVAVLQWMATMLVLFSRVLSSLAKDPLMPAMFILGDSLVDVGNNNYVLTLAKANYPPNGLDFPQGPSGRFCNGRTVSDCLVQYMGLPFPPAYLDPTAKGPVILQGLNYASVAAGILDSTGYNYVSQLMSSLPGSIYVYANAYDLVASFVANPARYGFEVVNSGCCGAGPYDGLIPCLPIVKPCPDRSAYLFWDPFHPTDKANSYIGTAFFSGGPDAFEPVNVMQLAAMP